MKLLIALLISVGSGLLGAYLAQSVTQEPVVFWWIGCATGIIVLAIID